MDRPRLRRALLSWLAFVGVLVFVVFGAIEARRLQGSTRPWLSDSRVIAALGSRRGGIFVQWPAGHDNDGGHANISSRSRPEGESYGRSGRPRAASTCWSTRSEDSDGSPVTEVWRGLHRRGESKSRGPPFTSSPRSTGIAFRAGIRSSFEKPSTTCSRARLRQARRAPDRRSLAQGAASAARSFSGSASRLPATKPARGCRRNRWR